MAAVKDESWAHAEVYLLGYCMLHFGCLFVARVEGSPRYMWPFNAIPVQISRRTFRRSVVRRLNERVAHERRFGPPAIAIISISSNSKGAAATTAATTSANTSKQNEGEEPEAAGPAQRVRARKRPGSLSLTASRSLSLWLSLCRSLAHPLAQAPLAVQRRRQSADCAGAATVYMQFAWHC